MAYVTTIRIKRGGHVGGRKRVNEYPTEDMEEFLQQHRAAFNESYLPSLAKTTNTPSREDLNAIRKHLETNARLSQTLKRRVKKNNMFLLPFPNGTTEVCTAASTVIAKHAVDGIPIPVSECQIVVCKEDIFDAIYQIHYELMNHDSYHKVFQEVQKQYSNVPRSAVQLFNKLCPLCNHGHVQTKKVSPEPIVSYRFNERIKVDLIDMQDDPDTDFKWIGVVIDHFSKYHVLFPMLSKEPSEVAAYLIARFYTYFGLPLVIHSHNGRAFVNEIIAKTVEGWREQCTLISGRPLNSEDQETHDLEELINAKKANNSSDYWASWLPEIQYALNNRVNEVTGKKPLDVIFKTKPNNLTHFNLPVSDSGIIMEEDVPDLLNPNGNTSLKNFQLKTETSSFTCSESPTKDREIDLKVEFTEKDVVVP